MFLTITLTWILGSVPCSLVLGALLRRSAELAPAPVRDECAAVIPFPVGGVRAARAVHAIDRAA
jgi:hypothetical protein